MSNNKEVEKDGTFNLSRDEFLDYVENKLWTKFQNRLWGIVGIYLTIVTVAGIFGIPYYINNELKSRLTKLEADFDIKRKEIIDKTKLLAISEIKREEKKLELLYRTLILKESLENVSDTLTKGARQLEEVSEALNTIFYENKLYEMHRWRFNIHDSTVAAIKILPSQLRYQEIIGSGGYMTSSAYSHPINDGTIGGLLDDIKIRLAHLNAMNGVIDGLVEDLVVYGNNTQIEKLQNKILLDLSYNEKNLELYDTLLYQNLQKHFAQDRFNEIIKYADLYKINLDFKVNSSQQTLK